MTPTSPMQMIDEGIENLKRFSNSEITAELKDDFNITLKALRCAVQALEHSEGRFRTIVGHEPFSGLEPMPATEGIILTTEALAEISKLLCQDKETK